MAYNTGSDPTLAELITAKFIPEQYSKDVFMATRSNLVAQSAFNTSFKKQLTKGSKVWIPVMTEGTATEVTPGTEAVASDLASTAVSITVDNWYYAAAEASKLIQIEDIADYLNKAAEQNGFTIQKKIDATVGALYSTLASSSVYGSDGQTFTDEMFRELVEGLDELDIPDSNRVLIGDSSTKRDMLDIEKFISNSYLKTGSPVVTGQVGELYGCKVLNSNNLTAATTGNYGVYAHRDAIGIVVQSEPDSNIYNLGWKFIAAKIIVDGAWGCDVIRTTFGKSFYTRKS
jgi:hypothetical protein